MAMGAVALAEAIGRLAMLAIIYLLIHQQVRLPWLASASVIASGISFIWLTIIISNKQKIRPLVNWQVWQSLLKQTWPVSLGVLLNLVYFRADSIIMSLTRPASDVGIYTAPYKLLEIIVTFPHMFMGLIMPLTGAAWVIGQQQRLNHLLQRTSEFFLIITMPMLMASLISGEKIMSLIAGKNYEISGTILFPLMLATVAIFAGTTFTYLIVTIEKQKIMLINYAVAASGALILYFWLIPTYSYIAASWITAGIEVFIALSAYIICQRFGQIKLLVWPLIKIIICGIIMLIALWLFNNFMIIEQLLIGLIIYLLVLFIFGAIKKKDFQAIIKLKSHV
jgi:O-antigen/teichoic acid export membrane protein